MPPPGDAVLPILVFPRSGTRYTQVTYTGDANNTHLIPVPFTPRIIAVIDTDMLPGAGGGAFLGFFAPDFTKLYQNLTWNVNSTSTVMFAGGFVDVGLLSGLGFFVPANNVGDHYFLIVVA